MQSCWHPALSALFIVLVSLLCARCQFQEAQQQCLAEDPPQLAHYIVRFKAYDTHEHLRAYLSQGLAGLGESTWAWVDRDNLASSIPTDFALLAISSELQPVLSHALLQLPLVRDMHPDRRLQGSLKWVPEGRLADAMGMGAGGVAFDDEGEVARQDLPQSGTGEAQGLTGGGGGIGDHEIRADDGPGGEDVEEFDVSVSKRPGRFSTPFLMQPEEEDEGQESEEGWEDVDNAGVVDEEESWRGSSSSNAEGEEHRNRKGQRGAARDGPSQKEVGSGGRRKLLGRISVTSMLQADRIWELGYSGRGVKVSAVKVVLGSYGCLVLLQVLEL
eukprot:1156961-Pelagomonas_calceolata.AAC.1